MSSATYFRILKEESKDYFVIFSTVKNLTVEGLGQRVEDRDNIVTGMGIDLVYMTGGLTDIKNVGI